MGLSLTCLSGRNARKKRRKDKVTKVDVEICQHSIPLNYNEMNSTDVDDFVTPKLETEISTINDRPPKHLEIIDVHESKINICQHSLPLTYNEMNSSDVDDFVIPKLETEIITIDDRPPPKHLEIIDVQESRINHSIPLACNEINSSDVDDSVALKLETEITTIDDIPPPNRLEIIDVQESRINHSISLACNEINFSDVDNSVTPKLEMEITTINDRPPKRLQIIDIEQELRTNESGSSDSQLVSADNILSLTSLTERDTATAGISNVALKNPRKYTNFSSVLKDFITDGKSPISILNELKICLNKDISYSLIAVQGELHMQTFVIEVKCGSMTANGKGSSKKIAKNNAAKNFIELYLQETTPQNTSCPIIIDNHIVEYKRHLLNPICILQEMCIANYWAYPKYAITSREHIFETTCTLNSKSFKGSGITKSEAKKNAAQLMLNNLTTTNQ